MIILGQYLRARKAATPEQTHSSGSLLVGNSMYMTKLVEWPVVGRAKAILVCLDILRLYDRWCFVRIQHYRVR